MNHYKTSLFIFTRDLRAYDNIGLIEACKNSNKVIACFIFNPKIIETKTSRPDHRIQFLLECLKDLIEEFRKRKARLHLLYGDYTKTVQTLIKKEKIDAVFLNKDYTPFSKKRQDELSKSCSQNNIPFHQYLDHLLYDPNLVKTKEGKPYMIFSQFFRTATHLPVSIPQKNNFTNFDSQKLELDINESYQEFVEYKSNLAVTGGRKNCLKILENIQDFEDYNTRRNYPAHNGTTLLSSYSRFGCCSVRELYHAISERLGKNHSLMTEIHWKEFFSYILYHFPHIPKTTFRQKYSKITWSCNKTHFKAWKNGKTGFPIVDAGMNQLNNTGFMHNRVRMIAASFLTKDLHIDWKLGERYFAKKLIDYDLAVNNGSWQWAASTGCDAQPWFRIFNPWLQQKKFDPECKYIFEWVPELRMLSKEQVHRLEKESFSTDYPRPIVDHIKESKIAKEMFRGLFI